MTHNTKTAIWTLGTLLVLGVAVACHAESFGLRLPNVQPHTLTNPGVALAWGAPVDLTNVCGYRLYATNAEGGSYVWQFFSNTVTHAVVTIAPSAITWFSICAYNSLGEGPRSNFVHVPGWPVIRVDGGEMDSAISLAGPWTFFGMGPIILTNPPGPSRFWRAVDGSRVSITNLPPSHDP